MTDQEIIFFKEGNYEVNFEDLNPAIEFDLLQDLEYVSSYLEMALKSDNENLTKAACAIYFNFIEKRRLETYLNQLIINPNHRSHQRLVKHLQDDLKYPSSVPFIREVLESGFDYLQYSSSEEGVIAKWFSHALNSIGTEDAISLMKEYSKSSNIQIQYEMAYRLAKGQHLSTMGLSKPSLDLEYFEVREEKLPTKGMFFIGHEKNDIITFYAAFNKNIANDAVKNQKFNRGFNFKRMTWIKPGFMWMMHRSGWALKENQENILAISIKKSDVLKILNEAVLSSYSASEYKNEEEWKHRLMVSNVRIQWDPDHNEWGGKLERKAIQIGLKGETLLKFNSEYIQRIEDITEFVELQRVQRFGSSPRQLLVPKERIVEFDKNYHIIGQNRTIREKIKQLIKRK